MEIEYRRISSADQDTARQEVLIQELGVEQVFIDHTSGKSTNRPELTRMMHFVREGGMVIVESISRFARNTRDLLYIDSVDRLGRNYEAIKEEWRRLTHEIGADVVALDVPDLFDSRKFRAQGDVGELLEDQMLSLLAWVAEQERKKILTRQREGIEIAKREGKYKGRKPVEVPHFSRHYARYLRREVSKAALARELGISRPTLDKLIKAQQEGDASASPSFGLSQVVGYCWLKTISPSN